ncbi:hypothetical protein A4A49_65685, partial [Nicotiana attenuata]
IGYSETQKGYRLYDLENRTFLVSRDIVFREQVFPFKGMTSDLDDIFPQDPPELTPIGIPTQSSSQLYPPDTSTQTGDILPNITHTKSQEHLHEELNEGSIDQSQPLNQEEADISMSSDPLVADIVEETEEISPAEEAMNVRKSVRVSRPPIWMKDYVAPEKFTGNSLYPISQGLSYANLTTGYQSYLKAFSAHIEPSSFKEAAQDNKRIKAMQ